MSRKRTHTIYCKPRGSEIATGCEILEFEKKNGKAEGRILFRFFISDKSKEQVAFCAEPFEAYKAYILINRVVRSAVSCKEKLAPHNNRKDGGVETLTSITFEKWVKGEKNGYAIIGAQTMGSQNNSFNVSVDAERLLFVGKFLESLSVMQSWEAPI